jgi:hypothetical protein
MHNITSPRSDDDGVEREIVAKGKTAPRITPADVEANIVESYYFTAGDGVDGADIAAQRKAAPDDDYTIIPWNTDADPGMTAMAPLCLLTFCVLVLRNGFTVTGESACASPENFDAEIGRKIARANAVQKVWPLMGYELRSNLAAMARDEKTPVGGAWAGDLSRADAAKGD